MPTTLYQRNEMLVVLATAATAAMPPMRPQKAPAAVARLIPMARMNTPARLQVKSALAKTRRKAQGQAQGGILDCRPGSLLPDPGRLLIG